MVSFLPSSTNGAFSLVYRMALFLNFKEEFALKVVSLLPIGSARTKQGRLLRCFGVLWVSGVRAAVLSLHLSGAHTVCCSLTTGSLCSPPLLFLLESIFCIKMKEMR